MRKRKTKTPPQKKRYILYARKSTTSEDRQVASIESQIEVMESGSRAWTKHRQSDEQKPARAITQDEKSSTKW